MGRKGDCSAVEQNLVNFLFFFWLNSLYKYSLQVLYQILVRLWIRLLQFTRSIDFEALTFKSTCVKFSAVGSLVCE